MANQLQVQQLQKPSVQRKRNCEHAHRAAASAGRTRVESDKAQCWCDRSEDVSNERHWAAAWRTFDRVAKIPTSCWANPIPRCQLVHEILSSLEVLLFYAL